jgi:poly(ADP-ribose) glycohydrolase ARH3
MYCIVQLYATPGGPKRASHTWQDYFARPAWQEELSTAAAVAPGEPGFQIKGTDAVAAAIWACVAHWEGAPDDAVVAAVHYGGDTDTIACMAGVCDQRDPVWSPKEGGW